MDRLAVDTHVVAIDYPGFGLSAPLPGSPTFDRLAEVTAATIDALGITDYVVYMFDIGAPVGFRIALGHDRRVRGVVTQNANTYVEGFGPAAAPLAQWWEDEEAGRPAVDEFVSLAGTTLQWTVGARAVESIDPGHALADQAVIDLPGRADYMEALLWDYRTNPARYPQWQEWLRTRRPAVLAVWGANDPFFVPAGAQSFRTDVPDAEVVLLDTGHFALEEEVDAVADLVRAFLARIDVTVAA